MIHTDGTPTIATAGRRGKKADAKRRWLARRCDERDFIIRVLMAQRRYERRIANEDS